MWSGVRRDSHRHGLQAPHPPHRLLGRLLSLATGCHTADCDVESFGENHSELVSNGMLNYYSERRFYRMVVGVS